MGQEPHLSSVAPIKFEMTPVTTILIAAYVVCRLARRGINTLIARWSLESIAQSGDASEWDPQKYVPRQKKRGHVFNERTVTLPVVQSSEFRRSVENRELVCLGLPRLTGLWLVAIVVNSNPPALT